MPHQNRVTPFGTLIATPERGTLNGNRGRLHDDHGQIKKQFNVKRWLICLLEFKGRRHPIMKPGLYTDLFFLDEATALSAGHRPCAECQRGRFNLFREHWVKANPELINGPRLLAPAIDAVLHRERIEVMGGSGRFVNSLEGLPDGTFVSNDGQNAFVVWKKELLRWGPAGYERPSEMSFPVRVLTPASVVRALAAGYPVDIHPTVRTSF